MGVECRTPHIHLWIDSRDIVGMRHAYGSSCVVTTNLGFSFIGDDDDDDVFRSSMLNNVKVKEVYILTSEA